MPAATVPEFLAELHQWFQAGATISPHGLYPGPGGGETDTWRDVLAGLVASPPEAARSSEFRANFATMRAIPAAELADLLGTTHPGATDHDAEDRRAHQEEQNAARRRPSDY